MEVDDSEELATTLMAMIKGKRKAKEKDKYSATSVGVYPLGKGLSVP